MEDVEIRERPRSTPPSLQSYREDDDLENGISNPAFNRDDSPHSKDFPVIYNKEPLYVSNGGSRNGFSSIQNHLIFDAGKNRHSSNDPTLSGTTKYRRANGDHGTRYVTKYATTRLPNTAGQRSKLPEGYTANGDLRPSKTMGRQSGHMYIRSSQRHSPRRQISSGGGSGSGGAGAILRKSMTDRKENCFSFFDVEMSKVDSYQYRPGEEVTGIINIIVRKTVEIRYVELVVTGQGHVTLRRPREGAQKNLQETYLYKQTYVIGSGDAAWTSVLTPGHYTSKFRVKLPLTLPSSLHHEDTKNGFTADIDYVLRVRICDDTHHSASHGAHHHGLVRAILSKKVPFNVQRAFDVSTIPDATSPVMTSEQVFLSCAHTDAAVISLNLDRAVCLAGDDIRLTLTSDLPASRRVKDITCVVQEHITFDPKHTPVTLTLSRMIRKDPTLLPKSSQASRRPSTQGKRTQPQVSEREEHSFEVTLPTNTGLISPYSLHSSCQFKVSYSLDVHLRISPAGGKLSFKVPLDIGPCAEPIYAEKISSRKAVPLFNRPTRFPCFSSHAPPTPNSTSRPASAQSARSAQVTTKYTNGCFARCFLCCMSATDD